MDSASSAGLQARLPTSDRISMSVMKMNQDQQKADGEAAVKSIESAKLAQEPGKGKMIDTMA